MSTNRFDILRLGLGLDEDTWSEQPVTPLRQRDAVFHDEARVRRLKSLGLTTPLHDLEVNKGQRGWEAHNLLELGLIGIDAIADHQELEGGATPDDIKALLADYARTQNDQSDASALVKVRVLRSVVNDCLRRHQRLHVHLQHAPEEFERLQVEQGFELGRGIGLPDPDPELLTPTLSLMAADALDVLDIFESALMPPRPPVAFDLASFVSWLLRAKRTPPEPLGAAVDETQFAPDPDPDRFDPATRAAVEALLGAVEEPTALSALLDGARDEHSALAARLLAMRGLAAFAPEEQPDSDSLLLADPAGALDDEVYSGDELTIERLRIAPDEPAKVAS